MTMAATDTSDVTYGVTAEQHTATAHQLDEGDQGDQAIAGSQAVLTVLPPRGVRVNALPPVGQCVDGFLQERPHGS